MADPFHDVAMAAADLKIAAPREFDVFVATLDKLEKRMMADLLAAGPDGIFTSQGKALLSQQLKKKIEECMSIKNQTDNRGKS
jgi:hypothetical protein